MSEVATLHIRNVPAEVYERLVARAAEAGRSLNAEVLKLLDESTRREARRGDWMRRLEEIHREFPVSTEGLDAVAMIREARDERSRRLRR